MGNGKMKKANSNNKDSVKPAAPPAARAASTPQPPKAAADKKLIRPGAARQERMGLAFSQVVAVLMRDPNFRSLRLSDLEWLVLPPVMAGQWRLAHASMQAGATKTEDGGILVPIAVALWARVSPAIDKRLSENLDKPLDLKAHEWASGNILWLIAAAGDPRAVPKFLKQLDETEFKGQAVKVRARNSDGKTIAVKLLSQTV